MTILVRNVRPWGGCARDLLLDADGIITVTETGADPAAGDEVLEGAGRVALPSFADVHLHLDSNRLGLPFRPHTGEPGTMGSIMNDRAHWRSAEKPVAERATYALRRMIELGVTHVRSHAQVDRDTGLEKFEGVLAARETHRDHAYVEVVAFPQVGIHLEGGVEELLAEALRNGADLVGGIDPCQIDRDPIRHLDSVFGLAERFSKPVDIHLHEQGSLGHFSLDLILERTKALGMQGQVTVSHAFCLADGSAYAQAAIDRIADLDVAVATVAPGRGVDLPLRPMIDAGVRVGLGMDGQRDYWSPYGNADMLDRTWQLAFTQAYKLEADLELTLAVATQGGRSVSDGTAPRVVHGTRPGLAVGDPADLVLLDAESAASAVMDRPAERTVVHAGNVVADRSALVETGADKFQSRDHEVQRCHCR